MNTTTAVTVTEDFGQVRRTQKWAAREAARWNESGDGTRHHRPRRTYAVPHRPAGWQSTTAEVRSVEGGFVCAYVTTFEPTEVLPEAQ